MELIGLRFRNTPYIAKAFREIVNHPLVKRYRPKVIVGGPASWEIVNLNVQEKLGIGCVVEGEIVAVDIFRKAVKEEQLPRHVRAQAVNVEDIAEIITPTIGGSVEITRGCGRGCKFCDPTLMTLRSMPKEGILREVKFNVQHGVKQVALHTDDFYLYGGAPLHLDGEKL